jgi:hypothetical protein
MEKGVLTMIKKILSFFLLLVLLAGCATNGNEQLNKDGQDNHNAEVNIDMQLSVLENENTTDFKISLTNNANAEAVLEFSSGQQFEIIVKSENGEEVYKFSDGRMFTQAFQNLVLPPGESVEWGDTWTHNDEITSGMYEVTAKVLAITINEETLDPKMLEETKSINIEKPNKVTYPANDAFQNITITKNGMIYTISGEARVYEGVFQYEIKEAGNVVLSGHKKAPEGAPTWSQFTFTLDLNNVLTGSGSAELELFVYSANDGAKEKILVIPLP